MDKKFAFEILIPQLGVSESLNFIATANKIINFRIKYKITLLSVKVFQTLAVLHKCLFQSQKFAVGKNLY